MSQILNEIQNDDQRIAQRNEGLPTGILLVIYTAIAYTTQKINQYLQYCEIRIIVLQFAQKLGNNKSSRNSPYLFILI